MIWKKKQGVRWHWQHCNSQGRWVPCRSSCPVWISVASRATQCVCAKEARLSLGPPKPGSLLAPQHPGSLAGTTKGWWVAGARHPGQKGLQLRRWQRGLHGWVANMEHSSDGGKCGERRKRNLNYACYKCQHLRAATLRGQHCPRWPALGLTPLYWSWLKFSSRNVSHCSNGLVRPQCTVRRSHKPALHAQRIQRLLRHHGCGAALLVTTEVQLPTSSTSPHAGLDSRHETGRQTFWRLK